MTTSRSPLNALVRQADKIAETIKAFERGESVDPKFDARLRAARAEKTSVKIGVVMDDKLITLDLEWSKIAETSETALAAWILKLMRDRRETMQ